MVSPATLQRHRRRAPSAVASGGGFDPTSLPGLVAWYRPDADKVVLDGSANVLTLRDQSGAGHDAAAGPWPFVWSAAGLNGHPSIQVAAAGSGNKYLTGPVIDIAAGFLFVTVVSYAALDGSYLTTIYDGTDSSRLLLQHNAGRADEHARQSNSVELRHIAAAAPPLNTPLVLSASWDGTPTVAGMHIYLNGVEGGIAQDFPNASFVGLGPTPVPWRIGIDAVAAVFGGPIGDVLIYTQPQTDANRQALEASLAARYGITLG